MYKHVSNLKISGWSWTLSGMKKLIVETSEIIYYIHNTVQDNYTEFLRHLTKPRNKS